MGPHLFIYLFLPNRHVFRNVIDFTNHDFSRKNRERKGACCRKKITAINVIVLKDSRALKALNALRIQFTQ